MPTAPTRFAERPAAGAVPVGGPAPTETHVDRRRRPGAPGPSPRSVPTTEEGVPWLRPSARMLLVHPVKEAVSSLPAIVPLLVAGAASGRFAWWSVFALLVPVLLGVARWASTTYRVTPERIELRTGLVQRSLLTANLDRVRTVDVTATPLHRLLRLATVRIGTGASSPLTLDGLPRDGADAFREALLHRRAEAARAAGRHDDAAVSTAPAAPGARGDHAVGGDPGSTAEEELAAFRLAWLRFAPFTLAGLVAVAAVLGFGMQFLQDVGWGLLESAAEQASERLANATWWLVALVGAVAVLVGLTVLSVVMYAVTYGGYRLGRRGGTIRLVRGLLTTRSTSFEERRIRGAVLEEPVLLRLVRGARVVLLTTGLPGEGSGSDLLVPPAPLGVGAGVVEDVLLAPGVGGRGPQAGSLRSAAGDPDDPDAPGPGALTRGPLVRHGRAAARRRWTRALVPAVAAAAAGAVGLHLLDAPVAAQASPVLLVVLAGAVALGRVRSLGHARVGRFLVARSGVFPRRRSVLDLDGVLGWSFASTPFQRRVGLVTCRALTAAGSGAVAVPDVPEADAVALVLDAHPDLLAPFLRDARTR